MDLPSLLATAFTMAAISAFSLAVITVDSHQKKKLPTAQPRHAVPVLRALHF